MVLPPCGAFLLACLAAIVAAAPASAQPALEVIGGCGFSGTQVALSASGLAPHQRTSVELMDSADPLAGAPLLAREATTTATGALDLLLDVPATHVPRPADRSVRLRRNPDLPGGLPTILAAAALKTAARGVAVRPRAPQGAAGATERWSMTGLPAGTRLWAHYRRGGRTIARVALGAARGPCGVMRFALRTLPRGHEHSGAWDLWLTARRIFRVPRGGTYVRRPMTAGASGPGARVTFEPAQFRLVPGDPRIGAPQATRVRADATETGIIRALFLGEAGGAPVDFFERVDGRLVALGRVRAASGGPTILEDATPWSCSRRLRRFVAVAALPSGSSAAGADSVRTPSCAGRLRLSAPRRVATGDELVVRVVDRWGNGDLAPVLCITPPARKAACKPLVFPSAVTIATRKLRADRSGIWRVDLRFGKRHDRAAIAVGEHAAVANTGPTVLTTGDSMMLGVDRFLADELAATAHVQSDVRPGRGISKSTADWTQIAAGQVARHKPAMTVMLIGGADGYPMFTDTGLTVHCCEEPWIAEYERRVRVMTQTYGQHGRVYWATLPLPRTPGRQAISRAVNAAVVRAGAGVAGMRVVRLDELFTPDGYREVIRHRGRSEHVREPDGLHLNFRGQAIAAKLIAELIRGDARAAP